MKNKKSFAMALAMMLMLPLGAWAGSGSLFVNNSNGLTSKTKQYTPAALGFSLNFTQMSGDANCWYAEKDGKKYLLMQNAGIRFIQTTKSAVNLVLIPEGTCTVSCNNHSCIGLENANITIQGDGKSVLNISQTGKYKGIFSTKGSITFVNANVNITVKDNTAAISQEAAGGYLTFNNSNVTINKGYIYKKGKLNMLGSCFKEGDLAFNVVDNYLHKGFTKGTMGERAKLPKAISSTIVSTKRLKTMQNGIKLSGATHYLADAPKTLPGANVTGYPVVDENSYYSGDVYYVPTKDAIYLDNASVYANSSDHILQSSKALTIYVRGDSYIDGRSKKMIDCTSFNIYGVKSGSTLPKLTVKSFDGNAWWRINYSADSEIHNVALYMTGGSSTKDYYGTSFNGKNNCLLRIYNSTAFTNYNISFFNTQVVSYDCGFKKSDNVKKAKWGNGYKFIPDTPMQIVTSNYTPIDTRKMSLVEKW